MRCNNCGWNNPDTAERCEKCNRTLDLSKAPSSPVSGNIALGERRLSVQENKATKLDINTNQEADNKATKMFASQLETESEVQKTPAQCSVCGYPLAPGTEICPMCKTPVQEVKSISDKYTVKLSCLDDGEKSQIEIISAKDLFLKEGTVILLGELRYKVL